jgi:hypothetical protein
MSDSPNNRPQEPAAVEGPGVLASLPRTRPQRASARRAASRAPKPGKATKPSKAPSRQTNKRGPAKRSPAKRSPALGVPAPRQGFEAADEPDLLDGPVAPPGGAELVASAAELAGELAKTGVSAGARLVRDLLSRLPG